MGLKGAAGIEAIAGGERGSGCNMTAAGPRTDSVVSNSSFETLELSFKDSDSEVDEEPPSMPSFCPTLLNSVSTSIPIAESSFSCSVWELLWLGLCLQGEAIGDEGRDIPILRLRCSGVRRGEASFREGTVRRCSSGVMG